MHASGKPLTRQLDLNLLELFDTVYRLRNLTAAGQRLGLSQSAVSYGLAKLREMYGDALFVRMQRGVQPTSFADQLADPVVAALDIVRGTLSKTTFVPTEAKYDFKLAMSDIGERMFLPQLSGWLAKRAPRATLETRSPSMPELHGGLANGEIDLAVGFIPTLGKQIAQQTLFREKFVYLVRKGLVGNAPSLSIAQVKRLPHVIANPPGTEHGAAVEKVLSAARVRAPIVLRVGSFLSLGPIVAGTDLVAPVPANLAAVLTDYLPLRAFAAPVRFPDFDVCMYWHQRFHQDPVNVWLRQGIASLFGTGGRKPAP